MINEWLHTASGVNHVPINTLLEGAPPRRFWVDVRDIVEAKWPGCIVIERSSIGNEPAKAMEFVRFLRENSIEFDAWTSFICGQRRVIYFFTNPINAIQFKLWMG